MHPLRISLTEELLTSKEVCYALKWSRSTLQRRKREGCPFSGGRINASRLAWWVEQRDAAKALGLRVHAFLRLPRRRREKLLAQARASADTI